MEESLLKLLNALYPDMSKEDIDIILSEFKDMTNKEKKLILSSLLKRYDEYVLNTKTLVQKSSIVINNIKEIEDRIDADKVLNQL